MKKLFFSLVLMGMMTSVAFAGTPILSGDYVEVRSNHVLSGGCTYSAEADYDGNRAVLSWRISDGEMANMAVVAVVLGKGNLQLGQNSRETVLYVDAAATPAQQQILVDAFTSRYEDVFGTVKMVKSSEITFTQTARNMYEVVVPGEVEVATRTMKMADHEPNCDQLVWYKPFTSDSKVMLVQAAKHTYTGNELNSNWSAPDKRSAYVGTFSFVENLAAR